MSDLLAHLKAENAKTQSWIDEDPSNRCAGLVLEDVEYWNDMGIHTVEQYEHYMMSNTIYDLFKDVYGFRNRSYDFNNMSMDELKKEYDSLLVSLEENNKQEAINEARAIAEFESKVSELIASGAGDRETAIRWLRDAENDEYMDDGFFEYTNGLPYGYMKKAA